MNLNKWFAQIAETVAHAAGHAVSFIICCIVVIVWAALGPVFGFCGYVATRDQYRDHHRHVLDGLLNSELSKSG